MKYEDHLKDRYNTYFIIGVVIAIVAFIIWGVNKLFF